MSNDTDQHLPIGFPVEHYEIRAVLGIGGFGITYKAWDSKLERWVALKEFLPAELALRDRDNTTVRARSDKTEDYGYALERFLLEARTLAKFSHSNIVRVVDYLQANGTAYLIMEYVEGTALSSYLRKYSSRVPEGQLKAWFEPLLRGLSKVHDAGFLHRDIKPGNIYLRADGDPVLIDFGAARQAIGEHSRSVSGVFTPGYAPVEQYATNSKNQGPWTDLYAVGATLYRCISNAAPVDAPSRQSALMEGDPDPLVPAIDVSGGQYSNSFLRLIDELLVLPVKGRAKSAAVVLKAMEEETVPSQVTDLADTPTEVRQEAEPEVVAPRAAPSHTGSDEEESIKRGRGLLVIGSILLLALGGGYWGYVQFQSSSAAKAQSKAAVKSMNESKDNAEVEAKAKADEEARAKADADAKAIAIAEAKEEAEARKIIEADARTKAEAEAKENAREKAKHYSKLTLDLVPAEATVTLPDIGPKYSPGIELEAGSYRVIVKAEGYKAYSGRIDVDGKETTRVIALEKEPCFGAPSCLREIAEGMLLDDLSGLKWTQSDNGDSIDWGNAVKYCDRKGLGWRLPTPEELLSIYNANLSVSDSASCGSDYCRLKVSSSFKLSHLNFWSSEEYRSGFSVAVNLFYGTRNKTDNAFSAGHRALCVNDSSP